MVSVRMKPLPPPNGPRMAACWGVWGSWLGRTPGQLYHSSTGHPIHPAASWGGQVLGWYLDQARYLIHRSELGMFHSRMRGYMRPRFSSCMLLIF